MHPGACCPRWAPPSASEHGQQNCTCLACCHVTKERVNDLAWCKSMNSVGQDVCFIQNWLCRLDFTCPRHKRTASLYRIAVTRMYVVPSSKQVHVKVHWCQMRDGWKQSSRLSPPVGLLSWGRAPRRRACPATGRTPTTKTYATSAQCTVPLPGQTAGLPMRLQLPHIPSPLPTHHHTCTICAPSYTAPSSFFWPRSPLLRTAFLWNCSKKNALTQS